ncbi:MAG: copper resistance protein CopC [Armatimonadota bacterium]|nr:copper resistance protein CopC [Armatimonadota bacterium]MDR7422121.1 copper resistance protein CopC [Armatimonadota bacterium]MDR7455045.1 copper resistance protein CopC [Armatimonadota bacterium]MDR7455741.1 copper resistance protein CopC [Armatimonadota bacterium]MDR7497571.1 copper resistance protein CopC [Armatimonadota bacterium]
MSAGSTTARLLLAVVLAAMGLAASAGSLDAHAKLVRAEPRPGSTARSAPRVVRAWFDDELDPRRSAITVVDAKGARVDDGKGGVDLEDLDRRSMLARLRSIGPGTYTVRWTAVSADDGYVARGSFRFTVAR